MHIQYIAKTFNLSQNQTKYKEGTVKQLRQINEA